MAARPSFLEPSLGSLQHICLRLAPLWCHQCCLHLALWASPPQAPLSPSHALPCQGEASCNPSPQRGPTLHLFLLVWPRLTGHSAEHVGHWDTERGRQSPPFSFSVTPFLLFRRRDQSREPLIMKVQVQGVRPQLLEDCRLPRG